MWKKPSSMFEGPEWKLYLGALRNKKTEKSYTGYMHKFMEYLKDNGFPNIKNVGEILTLSPNRKELQKIIIMYIEYLKSQGKSPSQINGVRCAIAKLFVSNDEQLNWEHIDQFLPRQKLVNHTEAYTKEQVRQILEAIQDLSLKVAVLTLFTTGMRVGGLLTLKIKDLEFLPQYKIYKFTVYAGEPEEYYTYCTPECARAIQQYFALRRKARESAKNKKQFNAVGPELELGPEAPFLRRDFDSSSFSSTVIKNRPRNEKSLKASMTKIIVDAGLRNPQKNSAKAKGFRYSIPLLHGFRKTFDTLAIVAKVDYVDRNRLMGHSGKDITVRQEIASYARNELLTTYVENLIPILTISEEATLKAEKSMLEQKNKQLETEVEKRVAKALAQMKKDMKWLMEQWQITNTPQKPSAEEIEQADYDYERNINNINKLKEQGFYKPYTEEDWRRFAKKQEEIMKKRP